RPEDGGGGGRGGGRAEEGGGADRGDQHLVERAARHRDELAEEAEDDVTCLVEDGVDAVEERDDPARAERQPLGEDPEGHPEQEREPDGAARDRGHQSASVATTGTWSEGF